MTLARWNLILAVLAAVLAVPVALTWRADAEGFTPIERIPLLFEGLDPEGITRIELRQGVVAAGEEAGAAVSTQELVLVRQRADGPWRIGAGDAVGALVDGAQVRVRVFEHLLSVRADPDMVVDPSPDAAALAEHGLDPDQALRIRAFQGQDPVAELWVGRPSGTGAEDNAVRGVFVRTGADEAIRLYEGARFDRNLQPIVWLDRDLLDFELGDVAALRIRSPFTAGGGIGFRKVEGSDATWEAVDPPEGVGDVKQQEITNLVVGLAALQARAIGNRLDQIDLSAHGLDQPEIEVAVELTDGQQLRLQVGPRIDLGNGTTVRFAAVTGRQRVVELVDTDVFPLRRKPEMWFGPPR